MLNYYLPFYLYFHIHYSRSVAPALWRRVLPEKLACGHLRVRLLVYIPSAKRERIFCPRPPTKQARSDRGRRGGGRSEHINQFMFFKVGNCSSCNSTARTYSVLMVNSRRVELQCAAGRDNYSVNGEGVGRITSILHLETVLFAHSLRMQVKRHEPSRNSR